MPEIFHHFNVKEPGLRDGLVPMSRLRVSGMFLAGENGFPSRKAPFVRERNSCSDGPQHFVAQPVSILRGLGL